MIETDKDLYALKIVILSMLKPLKLIIIFILCITIKVSIWYASDEINIDAMNILEKGRAFLQKNRKLSTSQLIKELILLV